MQRRFLTGSWEKDVKPEAGSSPFCTEKYMTSSNPSQKEGIATPSMETTLPTVSTALPRLMADNTPKGSAISTEISMEISVISSVMGSRILIFWVTVSDETRLSPRFPCRTSTNQEKYRATTGLSSPIFSRSCATYSSSAVSPIMLIVASPGRALIRMNSTMLMISSRGMTDSNFFRILLNMLLSFLTKTRRSILRNSTLPLGVCFRQDGTALFCAVLPR